MRGTRQLGYPKWPNAIPGESVPLDTLFTRTYDYDAFALSHVVPDGQPAYRLTKDYEGPLRFALIFADLDAHDLHADLLAEWKETERQRALHLFESKPGLLYLTRGGLRMGMALRPRPRRLRALLPSMVRRAGSPRIPWCGP